MDEQLNVGEPYFVGSNAPSLMDDFVDAKKHFSLAKVDEDDDRTEMEKMLGIPRETLMQTSVDQYWGASTEPKSSTLKEEDKRVE